MHFLVYIIAPALLSSDPGGALVGPIRATQPLSASENARVRAVRRAARDGMCTSTTEDADIEAIGGAFAATYGEISQRGFQTLGEAISLGSDDIYADCGSGLGRTVVQAAREFGALRAVGVEFAPSRHRLALDNLRREELSKDVAARVRLVQGDCADELLWQTSLSETTVVFASNLLFDAALNDRLRRRLEACASIRCVACLTQWPDGLAGFDEAYEVRCETSWSVGLTGFDHQAGAVQPRGGSPVYVYERGGGGGEEAPGPAS